MTKIVVQSSYDVHLSAAELLSSFSSWFMWCTGMSYSFDAQRFSAHPNTFVWHCLSGNSPLLPLESVWCFCKYVRHSFERTGIWHDASVQLLNLESYVTINISGIFTVPSSSYPTTPDIAVVYFQICSRYFFWLLHSQKTTKKCVLGLLQK